MFVLSDSTEHEALALRARSVSKLKIHTDSSEDTVMRKNRRDRIAVSEIVAIHRKMDLAAELDTVLPSDTRIIASQRLHAHDCERRERGNARCGCRDTLFSQRVTTKRVKVTSSRMDMDNMCTTDVDLEDVATAECDKIATKRIGSDSFAAEIRAIAAR